MALKLTGLFFLFMHCLPLFATMYSICKKKPRTISTKRR